MQTQRSVFILAIIFYCNCEPVFAQNEGSPYAIQKIETAVKIDGVVNEAVWQGIKPFPLTMHWPNFAGEITEETEIRIACDDQYLYVSAICPAEHNSL